MPILEKRNIFEPSISVWAGLWWARQFHLPDMINSKGKIVSLLYPEGQVKIKGEIWNAWSMDGDIDKGDEITTVGQNGLRLIVRRVRT
ncbi:NfeD family protein [Chloroflexota bacterium]